MVEGDGLENRWALFGSRGFESHPLREISMKSIALQPRVAARRMPVSRLQL